MSECCRSSKSCRKQKTRAGFRAHLTSYLGVNVMLSIIWLLTSGWGSYYWPIWPMLGWGIGLASHYFAKHRV